MYLTYVNTINLFGQLRRFFPIPNSASNPLNPTPNLPSNSQPPVKKKKPANKAVLRKLIKDWLGK